MKAKKFYFLISNDSQYTSPEVMVEHFRLFGEGKFDGTVYAVTAPTEAQATIIGKAKAFDDDWSKQGTFFALIDR